MASHDDDLVTILHQEHLRNALSNYRGNLQFAMKAVDEEYLIGASDPVAQDYFARLKEYCSSIGSPEDDTVLLGIGLAAPGMIRGIRPPIIVLEANRGGLSPRRLKEAAGQIERLRDALYLGRELLNDLNADTAKALRTLSDVATKRPPQDSEWIAWYGQLTAADCDRLVQIALRHLDNERESMRDVGVDMLQRMAGLRFEPLGPVCSLLVDRGVFWPTSLYRDADAAVAQRLVQFVDQCVETGQRNQALRALAWTRGAAALAAFRQWRSDPPKWALDLPHQVEEFSSNACWTLDRQDMRRELISTSCFRLTPARNPERECLLHVPCRSSIKETCPSCSGQMAWLFDFSKLPTQYLHAQPPAPQKVFACLNCACFRPQFSRYSAEGSAERHPSSGEEELERFDDRVALVLELEAVPFPPFACAEAFALNDASTLGGAPMWLQSAEYPQCPECGELMPFLAQLDNGALEKPEEGIFYAFYCPECRVSAVSYQQT